MRSRSPSCVSIASAASASVVHQPGDRVQRVEQEVRVQLALQRLELRLDQPRFELRGAQLTLREAPVVAPGLVDADQDPVRRNADRNARWRCARARAASRRSRG